MPIRLMSFDAALKEAGDKSHLLLGNGFSISWRPNIFTYASLFDKADFNKLGSDIKRLFERLKTKDFELVMRALLMSAEILRIYSPSDKKLIERIEKDAMDLKGILVTTIASNHPENPSEISESEYYSCSAFFNNFKTIYTLNYDLLLYWVIMHYNDKQKVIYDDGFRTPDSGIAEYVTWEIERTNHQNIFYLHGALHIFDEGSELQKYTWVNTGIRLIEQIRTALDKGYFPVFVSEGSSKEKKDRITHSNYLSRGYRSFSQIGNSLFIFGHSLADTDDHILNLESKGKVSKVFISIYGDPRSPENLQIIKKGQSLARERNNLKYPLEAFFYQAESAKIWTR